MYSDTDHMLISDGGLKAQGKMFCQVLSEAALRARALRNCLRLVTVPLSPDWCGATGMGFPLADSSISADRGILKLGWDNHYVLHHPPPSIWIMVLFPASTSAQWSLLCWEHCSSKSLYSSWNDNLTWFYRGGFKALCLFLYALNESGLCLDKCVPSFSENHVQWIASVPSDLQSSSRDILMMIKRKQAAWQISWERLSEGCVNWVFMGSWSKTDVKEMDLIYFLHFIMRCELSKRRRCAFCFFMNIFSHYELTRFFWC